MKNTTLASRYAKSLLDLALEKNLLKEVNADAKLIIEVAHNHEFAVLLNSPIINADKKIEIYKALFGGKISDLTLSFLTLLTNKNREKMMGEIAEEFQNQYNKLKNIQKATVITANGLDENLRKKVYEVISKSANSEVELVEKIDKDILGGFIIKIGSTQIDSSVIRSIRNLKQALH
jgi:F-type H+-transporting ATPase subunit delta